MLAIKNRFMNRFGSISFLLGLLTSCVSHPPVSKTETEIKTEKVTLLHQSNRWGSLDPCGCSVNPFGGVDREWNAIQQIRQVDGSTLFVDAGNMFVRLPRVAPVSHYVNRATAITDMLNKMGLDVFAPGPNDYDLGVKSLKALEKKANFKYLSTNVVDKFGKTVFAPYQVVEREGVRYGFVSITPTDVKLPKEVKAIDPSKALSQWMPKVRAESDVVILLSQLDARSSETLAEKGFNVPVVIGADPGLSSQEAFLINHDKTVYVDTHVNGNLLGRLYFEFSIPTTDFKAGHMVYNHELTNLDKERFGTPNEITKLIEKEKERTRRAALK